MATDSTIHKTKTPHTFQIGDRIVLTGLRSASHLNDRHGTVGTLPSPTTGRIGVDLDLDPSQARVDAKPSNLTAETEIPAENNPKQQVKERAEQQPLARNGTLVEIHHGRTASFLLEAMRYIAAVKFQSDPDVQTIHDIDKIRTKQGQKGLLKINHFNATAWTNWLDDGSEVEHRRKGVLNHLRTYIQEELSMVEPPIAEVPRASEALDAVEAAGSWHIRIHGDFWVVGHDDGEGGTGGTYLVPNGNQHMVYRILGVRSALYPMIRQNFGVTPVLVTTTLIPWYGVLLYDGVATPRFSSRMMPTRASEPHSKKLKAAVRKAVTEGRVVERIRELEILGAENRVAILPKVSLNSSAVRTNPPSSTPNGPKNKPINNQPSQSSSLQPPPPPTVEETSCIQKITSFRSLPQNSNNTGYWVYRRMGYTETDNPNHMGIVMTGSGTAMGPFRCSALHPSAIDILKDLAEKCTSVGNDHRRPWSIGIDDQECCRRLQFLFRDHKSGFRVDYYRPPSKEEQSSALNMGPGWNREEGKS